MSESPYLDFLTFVFHFIPNAMQCLNCELPCILRCASSPRRAERPYRSARQPRVRVPFFFIGFHGFKKELQWRTTTNESQSFPPPQPPAFPFLLLFPSLSSSFRQPRLTRSRSRAAPVRPRYSLQCLLLTFFVRSSAVPRWVGWSRARLSSSICSLI